MSVRAARALFVAFFAAYAIALTWPGIQVFNHIRPLVLGLPLSFAGVAIWVLLGFVVFVTVDRAERKAARGSDEM
jgi:hypothetical protein